MGSILIQGGRVFDGEKFLHADLLSEDGIITAIEPNIDCKAGFTFDAAGMTVLPGLVDGHMHIAGISPDRWGAPAQAACWPFGVTAAADCSAVKGGQETFDVIGVKAAVYVLAGTRNDQAQLDNAQRMLAHFGARAVGIKVCYDAKDDETLHSTRPLEQICQFAHSRGLRVHVHTTNTPIPMAEVLGTLGKGDIATHVYHGTTHNVSCDGFASILDAKRRGVVIDAGFGVAGHVNFSVFARAVEAGAQPDTISTDVVNTTMFRAGRYGLTQCMSMAQAMGMEETAVFQAVTSKAADALGRPWGRLQVGGTADIAVLATADTPFAMTDRAGNRIESPGLYRCKLTVADGNIVYKD